MSTRNQLLKSLRGDQIGTISSQTSSEEFFQNTTLRPILKLQNDLLIAVFKNHVNKYNKEFYNLSVDKKQFFIENTIQKDIKFRNCLKGIVIGFFTDDEYSLYIQNSSNLNKRMMSMMIERLKSQIQLFDN
jgi:hypothetical protein